MCKGNRVKNPNTGHWQLASDEYLPKGSTEIATEDPYEPCELNVEDYEQWTKGILADSTPDKIEARHRQKVAKGLKCRLVWTDHTWVGNEERRKEELNRDENFFKNRDPKMQLEAQEQYPKSVQPSPMATIEKLNPPVDKEARRYHVVPQTASHTGSRGGREDTPMPESQHLRPSSHSSSSSTSSNIAAAQMPREIAPKIKADSPPRETKSGTSAGAADDQKGKGKGKAVETSAAGPSTPKKASSPQPKATAGKTAGSGTPKNTTQPKPKAQAGVPPVKKESPPPGTTTGAAVVQKKSASPSANTEKPPTPPLAGSSGTAGSRPPTPAAPRRSSRVQATQNTGTPTTQAEGAGRGTGRGAGRGNTGSSKGSKSTTKPKSNTDTDKKDDKRPGGGSGASNKRGRTK